MTTIQWELVAVAAATAIAITGVWAQIFMYRHPIPGMLVRYLLGFSFAVLVGLVLALDGVAIQTAILIMGLLTGLMYGHVFFDSILLFNFYHETGTTEEID